MADWRSISPASARAPNNWSRPLSAAHRALISRRNLTGGSLRLNRYSTTTADKATVATVHMGHKERCRILSARILYCHSEITMYVKHPKAIGNAGIALVLKKNAAIKVNTASPTTRATG